MFALGGEHAGGAEQRLLASWPPIPRNLGDALALPSRLEAAAGDRLGLRATLVRMQERLRWSLFGEFAAGKLVSGRGRLFLAQHDGEAPYSLIHRSCGYRIDGAQLAESAAQARQVLDAAARIAPATILIAPSAAPVYADLLPAWLRSQCEAGYNPGLALQATDPARIAYPLGLMQAYRAQGGEPIPPRDFHWDGSGVETVVDWYATTRMGRQPLGPKPAPAQARIPADVASLEPGVVKDIWVSRPQFFAGGIAICTAHPCEAGEAPIYGRVFSSIHVWRRQPAPGRLLILSDSFGAAAAQYFGLSFGQVRHVNITQSSALDAADLATLRHELLEMYRPDAILFLFHDAFFDVFPALLARDWFPPR